MSAKNSGKHLIILGAGASLSSGYPLARTLRLCMTSRRHLHEWLKLHHRIEVTPRDASLILEQFGRTLQLFLDGSYASVDEFGMLARGRMQKEVQELKGLMCFVLGLVNPRRYLVESSYYTLANFLFKKDSTQLRDDIAILNFNYDLHLEYTVYTARRARVHAGGSSGRMVSSSAIMSGFFSETTPWENEEGFFIGKLHGTIAIDRPSVPCDKILTLDQIFQQHRTSNEPLGGDWKSDRFRDIKERTLLSDCLPVVFPWELFDESGNILNEPVWDCHVPGSGPLREIMIKIWNRAAREVAQASQISFVGLSMHHYLEPGLRRLLSDKKGPVKLAFANPDIRDMDPAAYATGDFHPRCSLRRIRSFLKDAAPGMEVTKSQPYLSFDEFIQGEVAF